MNLGRKPVGAVAPMIALAMVLILSTCTPSCEPPGATIDVHGHPFDAVFVQRAQPIHPGVCCLNQPFGNCRDSILVQLDDGGGVRISGMVDEMSYTAFSPLL